MRQVFSYMLLYITEQRCNRGIFLCLPTLKDGTELDITFKLKKPSFCLLNHGFKFFCTIIYFLNIYCIHIFNGTMFIANLLIIIDVFGLILLLRLFLFVDKFVLFQKIYNRLATFIAKIFVSKISKSSGYWIANYLFSTFVAFRHIHISIVCSDKI